MYLLDKVRIMQVHCVFFAIATQRHLVIDSGNIFHFFSADNVDGALKQSSRRLNMLGVEVAYGIFLCKVNTV